MPVVKSYRTKELLEMYGSNGRPLSYATWLSWIRPFREKIGKIRGKEYTPKQVQVIFDELGTPNTSDE